MPLAHALGQIPSVTEILRAVGLGPSFAGVPAALLAHKRALGTALHRAIQYDIEGVLDEDSLHPEIAPGFAAYRAVCASGFAIQQAEVEIIDAEWRVVGHLDALGTDPHGRDAVIDWKYSASLDLDAVAYQVAAYRWLCRRGGHGDRLPYAIELHADRTFRVHALAARIDELRADQVVYAAIVIYHAQRRRNG